jgi:hypothetical protein
MITGDDDGGGMPANDAPYSNTFASQPLKQTSLGQG